MDRALGAEGYYGAYTINAHTDMAEIPESDAVVASALARGVPIVTSRQMLNWLDFRNDSKFESLSWNGNSLSFSVTPGAGADEVPSEGLQVLLPMRSAAGVLAGIIRGDTPVTVANQTIKGVVYVTFVGAAGSYVATYAVDTHAAPADRYNTPVGRHRGQSGDCRHRDLQRSDGFVHDHRSHIRTAGCGQQPGCVHRDRQRYDRDPDADQSVGRRHDLHRHGEGWADGPARQRSLRKCARRQRHLVIYHQRRSPAQTHRALPGRAPQFPRSRRRTTPARWNSASSSGPIWPAISPAFGSTKGPATPERMWATCGQSSGTNLATATFTNETGTGWQQVAFPTPVPIAANTVYVASYHAPNGGYAADGAYFANSGVDNPPIHLLQNGVSGGNGVYAYGPGGFPTQTWNSTNYWVDVVLTTSVGPDTTAPTVTATLPAAGATAVNPANPVTATFSEAMDPATINASTFELRDSGNNLVSRAVTYNGTTATLTPTNPLAASTTYNAKVIGGSNGVKDLAGNALATDYGWSFTTGVDPCSTGGNPIVCENSRPGSPSSEWDISGAGDPSIQGFATDISVNRGETVRFKIDTSSTDYRLDIYRMGYYQGSGARKVATVQPSAALPQSQPACFTDTSGLIDCGNWADSASWAVPSDATSGIYFAKAVREDGTDAGKASHIVFIVRNDSSTSDILFQTSDTTWHAYNTWGGNSLYTGSGPGTGGGR